MNQPITFSFSTSYITKHHDSFVYILELLCFVKYDVPTEYLTVFSSFAVLVNQCFDSKEFERCKIWTMFASVGPFVMNR